jgi:cell division protein FtsW (lipid II flippase)
MEKTCRTKLSQGDILYPSLATLLLLVVFAFVYPRFATIGTDGTFYALLGQNIAEGKGLSIWGAANTIFSPFLPFFIAVFYGFGLDIEFAAHAAVMIFALASLPVFYFTLRKFESRAVASVGLLFLAVNGSIVWISATNITPQIPAGFLSILFFSLLLSLSKAQSPLAKKVFFSFGALGGIIGTLYLNRPEYFFSLFFVLAYFCVIFRKEFQWKTVARMCISTIAGFLLVAGPYFAFLENNLGYWTISGRQNEAAIMVTTGNYEYIETEGSSSITTPPNLEKSAADIIKENFWLLVKKTLDGLITAEQSFLRVFGVIGITLLAYGLREFILKRRFRDLGAMFVCFLPVIFIALFQGGSPNYLIQFFFIIIYISSVGFVNISKDISETFSLKRTSSKWLMVSLAAAASLYFFFVAVQNALFLPKDYVDKEYRIMGAWAKENISGFENETIFSRKPELAFYTGSKWAEVPTSQSVAELIGQMKLKNVKYLMVDSRAFRAARPNLGFLVDAPEKMPKEFSLIHKTEWNGQTVVLYRLNESPH